MSKNKMSKKEVEPNPETELKKEIFNNYQQSHGTPVTRRELLASGAIPFAGALMMPSWLRVFSKAGVAQAQDLVCSSYAGGNVPPFFQIKLNGGWAASYNMFPLTKEGGMPDSSKYGGNGISLLNNFKNNANFTATSGFYAGLTATATQVNLMKTIAACIPCVIGDDSSTQALGLLNAANESGTIGKLVTGALGTQDTASGLAANGAVSLGVAPPLLVNREEDILGSLGVSGALSVLSTPQKTKLFNTIQRLTAGQVAAISGLNGGQVLSQLMQCANISNSDLVGNTGNLNISPLSDPAFATIWNITNNTATNTQDFVFATLANNAINGNSGPAGFSIGGYDYHGNAKAATDAKDNAAGVLVGRLIESLATHKNPDGSIGKAGFITLCSDGAVTSMVSSSPGAAWTSDGGGTGCIYMFYFDPSGIASATANQIGQMTSGGRADDTFFTGGDPEKASAAVLYNYLILAYGLVEGDNKFTQVSKKIAFDTTTKSAVSIFHR